ncbi:MAG TPA: antibiotic biosynthesis monooxygenase [Syntrophales bacterium]|nr:antibiotic biosynthesis monooxygenase [Syntrophales bacterium]
MSVNVLLEVQSKPEKIDELRSTFKNILPDTRSYDGCQGIKMVGNQDDPCNLVLIEKWASRKQYEKYIVWRTETGALEKLGTMLSQPPSIRYYDDIDA